MSDEERCNVIDFIAADPDAGVLLDGGLRKARIPGRGRGKSGGYRVITYYLGATEPVFLLTVISKGQQANLTAAQKRSVTATAKDEKRKRGRS